MIQEQQTPFFDESVRRIDDPVNDEPGPQGAALILELQKLRHALDVEGLSDRRAHASRADGPERRRLQGKSSPKQRRRKGRVGQAIEVWLQPFRSKTSSAAEREAHIRPQNHVEPQLRRGATAPRKLVRASSAMPQPTGLHQSMSLGRLDVVTSPGATKTEGNSGLTKAMMPCLSSALG